MPDDPNKEMLDIQKHMEQIVDKMRAMMIADVAPEERRAAKRWVRSMFERFTERARRVIFFAHYEARQFSSMTIETEHFLLGLIREDRNLMNRFLRDGSSIETIQKAIEGRTTIRERVSTSIDLPLSNECKRILAYAAEEAERLNHRPIGTEHLLLGILREEKCVAGELLHECGLRLNPIREELARTLVDRQTRAIVPEEVETEVELPEAAGVPDADSAKRIAEAAWVSKYGADTVVRQAPIKTELKFNVWIVSGSSSSEVPLFAFISQEDGRILDVGGPTKR